MSDIRDLIRSVADDQPDSDLDDITMLVVAATPQEQLLEFYSYALRQLVADVLRFDRQNSMDRAVGSGSKTPPANKSAKLEQRRNWWAEMLASRVHLGNSNWKALAECTIDDLQFCIDERQGNILRIEGQMANFKHLQLLLVKHGVRTIADLPAQQKWETAA